MQVVLVMFRSDGDKRSFSLPRSTTVIGRREDCDLRIPLGEVSRKHCRFIADDGMLRLEDMGSSNGTFHNGVRIQETIVQPGDRVQVGPVTFVVQIDGVPADTEIESSGASGHNDDTDIATMVDAEEAEADKNGSRPKVAADADDDVLAHLAAPPDGEDQLEVDMDLEDLEEMEKDAEEKPQ